MKNKAKAIQEIIDYFLNRKDFVNAYTNGGVINFEYFKNGAFTIVGNDMQVTMSYFIFSNTEEDFKDNPTKYHVWVLEHITPILLKYNVTKIYFTYATKTDIVRLRKYVWYNDKYKKDVFITGTSW